jgi:LacI family transcriptional regulator, repressor for deo operon, udp, cdd, tsx, nupC, and nupG
VINLNIRRIAEEAGVSIATVSRVINGKKDVSEKTRQTILEIMKKKEFKPKVAVSPIVDNVGIFISDDKTKISNPYTSLILSGIADVIFNQHLCMSLIPSAKIPREGSEFLNFCRQRRISGGIFLSSTLDDLYIKELGKQVPVVITGNNLESECVGSVRSDNISGAYNAVKYLIKLGHTKILLVMADLHFADHKDRYEGAKKALEEANLEPNQYNITNTYVLSDMDLSYTLEFAIKSSKPDAIFVGGDQEAIRVLRAIQDKGIKIPEDISIIGYDNLPIAASSHPPLTTVNQPVYEIGKESAKMLLEMLRNKRHKVEHLVIQENHLMVRESVLQRN